MWQMLRWLLQWFNKLFKYPFDSRRPQADGAEAYELENNLPELTNADLELLFNELLEGVHQAKGQEWALKFLRRMEPRITVDRWIDWLLVFGEKLLSSPAPNSQTATRMVKLGELNIGKVGELASEIGVQLLSRDFLINNRHEQLLENVAPQRQEEPVETSQVLADTPGQQLLRDMGEQLWEYEEQTPGSEPNHINIAPVAVRLEETWENGDVQSLHHQEETSESVVFEFVKDEELETGEQVQEVLPSPVTDTLDHSLTHLEPQVAQTLDELVVRLEQSTSLVQQLASELALRDTYAENNQRLDIFERPSLQMTVANQAQQWFYQGLQQAKSGNLLGALRLYGQATQLEPSYYDYWFNQGLTLFHLHRFDEAIAAYDQALRLKPDFAKAWYNRGGVLGELGEFEEAIASFDQAIEIKPNYQEAWSSRGLALLKLGLVWEAISSYEQALSLQPEDQETWYYRGVALGIVEQFEEAIASYNQALTIQPDYHEVLIDRGVVLFSLQRWSEAIESWDQALAIQSDFYLAWYNRGIALENLGRREESIESYQQAINAKPDFHLAWYNQAVALFYLDRLPEAISCYDNALEIKLDYWEAWLGRALAVGKIVDEKESLTVPSAIAKANPALNRRGYEGKLATYHEGLKYLRPDTHPEGWGRLHLALGNTNYEHGKKQPSPREFWQQARSDYQQALLTLTAEDFTELHLEVLQALTKVLIITRETSTAQELQKQGLDLLGQLLNQNTRSEQSKKQLALKFITFQQLGVDLAVNTGDLVEAWEIAEQSKNTCLKLTLSGWQEQIYSPAYREVQKLLNPTTAIIYWHISPVALHTFIIKHEAPSPLSLLTPIQDLETLPETVQRLVKFENWLEDWQKQHQESSHSWKLAIAEKLSQLQEILNISTIIQELEGIENLILIPHRDLNKLPLHTLFPLNKPEDKYTISYLPSVQVGLELNQNYQSNWQDQKFLSVENIGNNNQEISDVDFAAAVVRNLFDNAQHLQGEQVEIENIKNALSANYNIFHFTGNVINNYRDIKKSALILANEEQLTLEDLMQCDFHNYHLFTFTNCQNPSYGIQNINSEYINLPTSLLSFGVPCVVTTLWQIESSVTAIFVIEFYRQLLVYQSPVIAIREATNWLKNINVADLIKWYEDLQNNLHPEALKLSNYIKTQIEAQRQLSPQTKPYNSPYFWSGFILLGIENLG
ncbi:MAG: tetratricopeptide repeat protein [Nostocales cyanobacterium]|nr:MAG: tetratricopeptide repeat protein [Nostocales cyanobacterium]TAF21423.1 MAG: tetratricopeptide repeat protein [Nostocales cyanobacterium]